MGKDRPGQGSEEGLLKPDAGHGLDGHSLDGAGENPPRFHLRAQFYGRRKGRPLRGARAAALERIADFSLDHLNGPLDPQRLMPGLEGYALEIGFGGGEHLRAQIEAHPRWGFIGIEPFVNGVAGLLKETPLQSLSRLRLSQQDARLILPRLPDGLFDMIYILFPDPWPKARHQRRRIVNRQVLTECARIAKPGAELRLATDIPDYCAWMFEHLRDVPAWRWTAERADDWRIRPDDWPQTRYERKALREGRKAVFLRFIKEGN